MYTVKGSNCCYSHYHSLLPILPAAHEVHREGCERDSPERKQRRSRARGKKEKIIFLILSAWMDTKAYVC